MHAEREGAGQGRGTPPAVGLGLAYWTDGTAERVLYVTLGFRLVALDAATGRPVPGFGDGGRIDLKAAAVVGEGRPIDPVIGEIGLHATPAVARDVVVVGGTFADAPAPAPTTTPRGWCRRSTCGRAGACGRSTPFPVLASRGSRRG